jgi:hypothetical protein
MCIANAPLTFLSSPRQSYLANIVSGCDQCYSLWCRWPVGNSTNPASRGLLRMWAIISHSHLVHANSSSRPPLYFRELYCANTNQMSTDPNAGLLPTPSLMHWGIIACHKCTLNDCPEQSVNALLKIDRSNSQAWNYPWNNPNFLPLPFSPSAFELAPSSPHLYH